MPLPTLVIAGAQKCGTSSLVTLLRQHPQVSMSRPKELHFFDRHFDRGLDWYREQFTMGGTHLHAGEGTPAYLYDPATRARMMETLPEAKIVVILRDPARRAYSHYWHERRLGHESSPFEEALDLEKERLATGELRNRKCYSYVDRGHYIDQIEALESGHARERIHVLLFEDLIARRVASLKRLFEFLGVDTEPAGAIKEVWRNPYRATDPSGKARSGAPTAYPPIQHETRARLVEHFTPHNDRMAAWLGQDLSPWNVA